jgi:hypothetical protein
MDLGMRRLHQIPKGQEIQIDRLADIDVPHDIAVAPWQWGKQAAKKARTAFGIGSTDAHGARALFDALGIDPSKSDVPEADGMTAKLSGGLQRSGETMHMALADADFARRRFAAARGVFLGWNSGAETSHLITIARTRSQQASRAFAAELLAPFDYIRSRTGGSAISSYRIEEIAEELEVSSAVVKWQAHDNHLKVVDGASW